MSENMMDALDWLNEIITNPNGWRMFYSDSETKSCAEATIALLKEQEDEIDEIADEYLDLGSEMAKQPKIVMCKDCEHGSLYCTEDVCGETLIECNRPDLGDVIEIHGWKWFCADGECKEGR